MTTNRVNSEAGSSYFIQEPLTGLGLAFGRDLGFSRQLHGLIKEIHSFCQYLIYAFVILHLAGVIIADNTKNRGLVSGMINGNN